MEGTPLIGSLLEGAPCVVTMLEIHNHIPTDPDGCNLYLSGFVEEPDLAITLHKGTCNRRSSTRPGWLIEMEMDNPVFYHFEKLIIWLAPPGLGYS